jgi:predicted amidophosphoribosyltransferase
VLLPTRCPVCWSIGPAPCTRCRSLLRPAPPSPPPAGLDTCASLLAYTGAGRQLLVGLKYRNARSTLGWLSDGMAELVAAGEVDLVTWVPTSPARRRQRGFDQAALLARAVSRRLRLPCVGILSRMPGPPQTGRPGPARRRGPSFAMRRPVPASARVLLVDDVVTTGATLTAAAGALRGGGALELSAVTAARTPLKLTGPAADA